MTINPLKIKVRFLVVVLSNLLRAGITFLAGLFLARSLGPESYGDVTFLLGSFVAIRGLLDAGVTTAFFTHISGSRQLNEYYFVYALWVLVQFLITLITITFLMPINIISDIWLKQPVNLILLAFIATFIQQQLWPIVAQITESQRKTIKFQLLNIAVSISYLVAIYALKKLNLLSIENIFLAIISIYLTSLLISCWIIKFKIKFYNKEIKIKYLQESIKKIYYFSRPLFLFSVISFFYSFMSKWWLQRYGGGIEQGYFQIGTLFSQVCLLATISILNIFWKEVAELVENGLLENAKLLYQKVNNNLVIFSALIGCFLFPWSDLLISQFAGKNYISAWPAVSIMFLYPIHQSMGQIGGLFLFSQGKTTAYTAISIISMLIGLIIAFILIASKGIFIGLGMTATAMAVFTVVSNIIGVNLQSLYICKNNNLDYNWKIQIFPILIFISLSLIIKFLLLRINFLKYDDYNFIIFIISGIIYIIILYLLRRLLKRLFF